MLLRHRCTAAPTTCCTTHSQRWELKSHSLTTHTILHSGKQQFVRTQSCSSVKYLRIQRMTCSTLKACQKLDMKQVFRSCSTTPCQHRTEFARSSGVQTSSFTLQQSSLVVTAPQLLVQSSTAASSTSPLAAVSLTSPSQTPVTTALHTGQRLVQVRTSSRHACKCCATLECRQARSMRGTSCRALKPCRFVWIDTGQTPTKSLRSCRSKALLSPSTTPDCPAAHGMSVRRSTSAARASAPLLLWN